MSYLNACTLNELARIAPHSSDAQSHLIAKIVTVPDIDLDLDEDEIRDQVVDKMQSDISDAYQDGYFDGFDRAMEHLAEQLCNCMDAQMFGAVHGEGCPLAGTTVDHSHRDSLELYRARDPHH